MSKTNIYNQQGEQVGEIELSDKFFGVKINEALVHQAVVAQTANARQVLAHTKDRSEVRGGGKKPWRQKGTGRARAGSSRSPIWIGGGVTFGPTKDRNFSLKINKKMKQKAILMALSDKVSENNLLVLEKLEMPEFKTKNFNAVILKLEKHFNKEELKNRKTKKKSILIINDKKDDKIKFSAKNLPGLKLINLDNINIVDLLKYKNLIMTLDAVNSFQGKKESNKK